MNDPVERWAEVFKKIFGIRETDEMGPHDLGQRTFREESKGFIYRWRFCRGCDQYVYGLRKITLGTYVGHEIWSGLDVHAEQVIKTGAVIEFASPGAMSIMALDQRIGVKHLWVSNQEFKNLKQIGLPRLIAYLRVGKYISGLRNYMGTDGGPKVWSDPSIRGFAGCIWNNFGVRLREALIETGQIGMWEEVNMVLEHGEKKGNKVLVLDKCDAVVGAVCLDIDGAVDYCKCMEERFWKVRKGGKCVPVIEGQMFSAFSLYPVGEPKSPMVRKTGMEYTCNLVREGTMNDISEKMKSLFHKIQL